MRKAVILITGVLLLMSLCPSVAAKVHANIQIQVAPPVYDRTYYYPYYDQGYPYYYYPHNYYYPHRYDNGFYYYQPRHRHHHRGHHGHHRH